MAHGEHYDEHMSESTASKLLSAIDELRGLFTGHFQSGWFLTVLERLSFNTIYLNDIRQLAELRSIYPSDYYRVKTGAVAIEEFVRFCRRYVQPVLRDQLGISGFSRHSEYDNDRTTQVVKALFASTFAQNIERLSELSGMLDELIETLAEEEGYRSELSDPEIELTEPRILATG
jgi:hypothetical protein